MLELTNDKLRLVSLTLSVLGLTACATSTTAPVELSKGTPTGASGALYSGQVPAPPAADAVIASLEQQLASAPRDVNAYLRLGVAYRHVERFEEALSVFEQAAVLAESPHIVQNEIGILYRVRGDFTKAESVYLGMLEAVPDFHDAHYNLGILYDLYLRRPLDAQKHYQAYINNAPEADEQVEKWLVDLERRHQIDSNASAGVIRD